jgi:hypothetical protein
MANALPCPICQARWADEYTHHDCPPGDDDHRHWVCIECEHEWVELILTSPSTDVPAAAS